MFRERACHTGVILLFTSPPMKRFWLTFLTGSTLLILSGVSGCASQLSPSVGMAESGEAAPSANVQITESTAQKLAPDVAAEANAASDASGNSQAQPQLIKRASLALNVDSVEESFEQVRKIVQTQQGDVRSLSDQGDRQRLINVELRIPQANLDTALDALTAIGTVQSRTLTTEDVSSQLVDLQARLSNARKSEEALQEIMSRSGEIADVLAVSRELSSVRQSIEQMAAQQKNLQNQVSYSTISLSLSSGVILSPNKPAFSRQLANSWSAATNSVGEFTTDLLQLGLWLMAYSPYLAALVCGMAIVNKVRHTVRNSGG